MEHYLVSARKYRPSTFKSVVGQKALTATLRNAIQTGRLAHSYLFCGSRGVGKTSCARIFAKTINCTNLTPDGEACNECDSCRAFNDGVSLNIIELDAASNNGVDDIRNLVEQTQTPPTMGRYRVFIVDEVHMLSNAAFNSFLKTLEEPPEYVIFILATTEKNKIIPTILSRCQIYDFNRITVNDIADHLAFVAQQENISYEPHALNVIARKADGALRDALSIFDQVAASSRGNITYASTIENLNELDGSVYGRMLDAFLKGDVTGSWLIYKEVRDKGFNSHFFINGLGGYFRDLMAARDPSTRSLLDMGEDEVQQLAGDAARCTPQQLYKCMLLCNDADLHYRDAGNKQFLVEVTLAKICQQFSPSPDESGSGDGQLRVISRPETLSGVAEVKPQNQNSASPSSVPSAPRPYATGTRQVQRPSVRTAVQANSQPQTPANQRMRISIKGDSKPDAQSVKGENSTRTSSERQRDEAFGSEQLHKAWETYMLDHPQLHLMVNTMRVSRPEYQPGTAEFGLTVFSQVQAEIVAANKPDLISWLRDYLRNDNVDFHVNVNENESSPRTWSEVEVFNHMKAQHPVLRQLAETFQLTLK